MRYIYEEVVGVEMSIWIIRDTMNNNEMVASYVRRERVEQETARLNEEFGMEES